jgi:hypothetical protein
MAPPAWFGAFVSSRFLLCVFRFAWRLCVKFFSLLRKARFPLKSRGGCGKLRP